MESGFKCGSGEPGSSFCVMMDILYHVPHLCGGFFAIFNELNSKRTLKITGVYKTSAISDVNDLPIDCIGIVYNSALHRPTPDGTIYAIFCLGNENDNVKSQFGYTIGKDTVSYVYRNYNYQNQLWSDWKQITTKY